MSDIQNFFCSDLAWELGIPLIGTATRGDIWFLLEYQKRWGAKAFEESSLSQAIKDHIQSASIPGVNVRTLLIRQGRAQKHDGLHFFVGQTHPIHPRLYEYRLQDYADLLEIDPASLVAGKPGDSANLRKEPLYLVCTNGKRDQCCSVYGPEIYRAMRAEAGKAVWQSSHIGGHNQAPITLFFPHGVNYAHTSPTEIRRLIRAHQQRKVVLHHYRGRVCFENHVQAAEHFWREQTGIIDLPDIRVAAVTITGDNEWKVTITDAKGENSHTIHLQQRFSDHSIPITCTKKKVRPISSFHRLG
jgi:hypothetical protein